MSTFASQKPLPESQSPLEVTRDLLDERSPFEKISKAVQEGRIFIALQPIVAAYDYKKILFYEALARICDEFGRVIPAGQFVHEIENDELGRIIDTEVLRLCLQQLATNKKLQLSMNMSARSIGHPPWKILIDDASLRDPSVSKRLTIEFTEDSLNTVPEFANKFITEKRKSGMSFAIDNFGRGATTFYTFKKFMFDIVKVDQRITSGILESSDSEVLLEAIVNFSHTFDMPVVVDRIDKQEILPVLHRVGVDFFQGFLFGHPKLVDQ